MSNPSSTAVFLLRTGTEIFVVTVENICRSIIRDGRLSGQRQTEIPGGLVDDNESPIKAAEREAIEETGGNLFIRGIVGEQQPVTTHSTYYKGRPCTLVVYMVDVTPQQIRDLEAFKPYGRTFQLHGKQFTNTETSAIVVKEVVSCMFGKKAPYLFGPHRTTLMEMFSKLSGVIISNENTAKKAVSAFYARFSPPKKPSITSRTCQMSLDEEDKKENLSRKLGDVVVKYSYKNYRFYSDVTICDDDWYSQGAYKGKVLKHKDGILSLSRESGKHWDIGRSYQARVLTNVSVTYSNNKPRSYAGAVFDNVWVAYRNNVIEIMGSANWVSGNQYRVTRDSGKSWDIGRWYKMNITN